MTDETKAPLDPHTENRMARRDEMERYQKAADDTQAGLLNAKKWYLDACHGELMAWLREQGVQLTMGEDDVFLRLVEDDGSRDDTVRKALLL